MEEETTTRELNGSVETTNQNIEFNDETQKLSDGETSSFLNVNNWGEPIGTKHEVLQSVFFCGLGLHVTFLLWGLLQERMLTQTYDGEYFEFCYGLVFINRLGTSFFPPAFNLIFLRL